MHHLLAELLHLQKGKLPNSTSVTTAAAPQSRMASRSAVRSRSHDPLIAFGSYFPGHWSAPFGVDRYGAAQLAICRACSCSNLIGLLYPSAEWRRLAL